MNILYKTTLVLLVVGVHSVGARKLPSKSANRRYGNDHDHRPSSFFNSRSDNNQKDKKNIGTTKRRTNGVNGAKGVNTKHQHIATKIVGGFTTNPQSSRQNHVNMLRRATTTTTRTNMGVSSSSSNQKDSYKRLQIPNTNPYSLNKYQYKYNTHTHTQTNNPMTMREQRNGNEQNFVTNSNPPTNVKKYRTIHRKQRNGHGRGKLALSSSTMAMSSPSTYLKRPSLSEYINSLRKGVASTTANIDIQDYAIFLTYICTQLAITLPVVLIPMIAADPYSPTATTMLLNNSNGSEIAGKIVAMSAIGAGCGKVINGFVCQGLGSRLSGGFYLLGLAAFSLLLSVTSHMHASAIAGMEFCSSIMWTACNVLIANRYEKNPKKFASTIATLGLCSTIGSLSSKVVGSALLSKYHWREVALLASMVSGVGSALFFFVVKDHEVKRERSMNWPVGGAASKPQSQGLTLHQISSSIGRVLSKRMFWFVAAAHSCSFIGRSCDKVLGTFLRDTTQLPRHFCGSLTSSVTLGFIIGLLSGRKLESMDESNKRRFVIRRQFGSVLSALSIALFANNSVGSFLGKNLVAAGITTASGLMAASLSVQFYQFPSKFARSFGEDKAVCISFIDAAGFFLSSPIWAAVSKIVSSGKFGENGWSVAWVMLSALFAIGGGITMKTLPATILSKDNK